MRSYAPIRHCKLQCGGYTLIELIMVMVILSIVGGVSSFAIMESMKVYARAVPAIDMSYKSNLAIQRLSNEVRDLQSTDDIAKFSANAFQFKDSLGRSIEYKYDGKNLTRNGDLLASGLSEFTFKYWAKDGKAAKVSADLHLVEVDFTLTAGKAFQRVRMPIFPRRIGL